MKKLCCLFLALLLLMCLSSALAEQETEAFGEAEEESLRFPRAEEDLAEGYIRQELSPLRSRGAVCQGDSLTGSARNLYDVLMPCIWETAEGKRESTVFSFAVESIFAKTTYTAAELGVETLVSGGKFTQEARDVLNALISSECALRQVMNALMADSPYELYWFDRTAGMRRRGPSYSGTSRQVTFKGEITVSMEVAEEYAAGSCQVLPVYGLGVAASARTARVIVDAYEDESDYDRLRAYLDALCELSSYHYAAEAGEVPYGNPWQLIWALDGDPETEVVCEGYAKAFQYLNTLSKSRVTVISPAGYLNGAAHMWNIVTMEDGQNYLADLTNCDAGMIGYPDRLFLVGCATGSPGEGYTFSVNGRTVTYVYRDTGYSEAQLRLSPRDYPSPKPVVPVFTLSASRGYAGCCLVLRLQEHADSILIRETGEEITCDGAYALIPLREAGTFAFSVAAVVNGVVSDYAEPVSIEVRDRETTVFSLPSGLERVEAEAFRGAAMTALSLPDSVTHVGAYAFADCAHLRFADAGSAALDETVFAGCPDLVLLTDDIETGLASGVPFLLR